VAAELVGKATSGPVVNALIAAITLKPPVTANLPAIDGCVPMLLEMRQPE
jgi:hypothetical protein